MKDMDLTRQLVDFAAMELRLTNMPTKAVKTAA